MSSNKALLAAAIAAFVVAFTGCSRGTSSPDVAGAPDEAADQRQNPMEIAATERLKSMVRVGQPKWANVGTSISVSARVEVDETRVTRVGSPVMGRVNTLRFHEGQEVHRGDVLAQVTSTGLSDGQLQLLKSLSQRQVAQRAVDRAQIMLKADVIGVAELQRREAELAQASAELAAARDQLSLLGMAEESIRELERSRSLNSVSRVLAPMDGTVLERHATLGQMVEPADTMFEIADLSNVWLVADVPEQIAGNLVNGQSVDAEIAALAGIKIQGHLSFVSATVNPETRTVRVRMDLPNPRRKYKPAMLATMVLHDQRERKLVVPATAVVRDGDTEHVFVKVDEDVYVLREVELGELYGKRREVAAGLQESEDIVTEGAFHLNNERRRRLLRSAEGE